MTTKQRAKRGTRPRLGDACPELAAQATDPSTALLSTGSNKKVEWECSRGHRWHATPCDRAIEKRGCPYCSGRLPIAGETDLTTTHPEIAAQLHGADPNTISAGSVRKFEWKCSRGHQWTATAANRALKGSGCPYCCGRLPIVGETDLATTHPELSRQAEDTDPTTLSRGSNKRVLWRCGLGHEWTATPNTRVNMAAGCPYCAGQQTLPGFNDLLTRYPAIGAEARSVDPRTISSNAKAPIEWECTFCPRRWRTFPANRTNRGSSPGCPTCHKAGFKVTEPAYLYLLIRQRPGGSQLKVGITNNPTIRFGRHRKYGWEPLDISPALLGAQALRHEQAFLRHLDALGVPRGKRGSGGTEPGFTETWNLADYPVTAVDQIISAVAEARSN